MSQTKKKTANTTSSSDSAFCLLPSAFASKPFAIQQIGFKGVVVRFDDDQRTAEGLISPGAAAALSSVPHLLLELRGVELDEADIERVLSLVKLAGLDMAGARGARFPFCRIGELSELVILDLSFHRMEDAALDHLAGLKKLQYLSLVDTQLSDEDALRLTAVRQLRELYLTSNPLGPDAVEMLRKKLPSCRICADHPSAK